MGHKANDGEDHKASIDTGQAIANRNVECISGEQLIFELENLFSNTILLEKVMPKTVAFGQCDDSAPAGRQREEDLHRSISLLWKD